MIYIESKKKSLKKLSEKYPTAKIVDVTSKAATALIKMSPFYPHGNIPVPFSPGYTSNSVEGIWQGLKVFENSDIDIKMFDNDKMKNLKRTVRKYGTPLGHRKGVNGTELLNYLEARLNIYLPSYLWVLENKVQSIITRLREASKVQDIVLLDYETNCEITNLKKPLSHAYLIKAYTEGNYPSEQIIFNPSAESKTIEMNKKKPDKSGKMKAKATQTKLF